MNIEELSNYQIVTLAVALLCGESEHVHPEDIAVKVQELLPGRFCWRKYPEQIDLDAVRVALRDAKKSKNGTLVTGSNIDGWMLTVNGINWIKQAMETGGEISKDFQLRRDSILINQEVERNRLRATTAFHLFTSDKINLITLQDFFQFAKINEYFKEKSRHRRLAIIDVAVCDDSELKLLWQYLKTQFSKELI